MSTSRRVREVLRSSLIFLVPGAATSYWMRMERPVRVRERPSTTKTPPDVHEPKVT
jgi:hypothetical protein